MDKEPVITVATTQYKIENMKSWQSYIDKISLLVEKAKNEGAQLLLMPEYAGIDIVNTAPDDATLFKNIQSFIPDYIALFQMLSSKYQIYIQPGTIPVKQTVNKYTNRAYFFGPDKNYGYQDKLTLVSGEKESQLLVRGEGQTIFETHLGLIGIAICYDSEFPELIRNFTQAGVSLILVPSYTPSLLSFMRVHLSCRARALENQCYVLLSSVVDCAVFGCDIERLTGQAALFTPVDNGFNDNGIHMQGTSNVPELLVTSLFFDKMNEVRMKGQVHNFNDFIQSRTKQQSLTKVNL